MRTVIPGARRTICFVTSKVVLTFCAGLATAAVPVVESRPQGSEPAARNEAVRSESRTTTYATESYAEPEGEVQGGGQLSGLFYQLQMLQQEVQELRGLVEEQGYQIERLKREQKDYYMDIDRRLTGGGAAVVAPAGNADDEPTRTATRTTVPAAADAGERAAYGAALDAMQARNFDDSLTRFNQFVLAYPNGALAPNAFYWIGELQLAKGETELARQSFVQVITLYPQHSKVPDALYKLGDVYYKLGDKGRALSYLNRVQQEFPGSGSAEKAAAFAAEIQ